MSTKSFKAMSLASSAFSLSGCAGVEPRANTSSGRIIEFKSGAEGFDTRTYFYEGPSEVIAFDAQFTPELARQSIQHLRTMTDKPITWLVLTHPNPDKYNGASVFKAQGAKIVASKATADSIPGIHTYKKYYFVEMAKMFTNATYPTPVGVDEIFDQNLTIRLKGGGQIELTELACPGVSSNQTIAWIDSARTLIVGDLIHHKAHAWLEGGIIEGKSTPRIQD